MVNLLPSSLENFRPRTRTLAGRRANPKPSLLPVVAALLCSGSLVLAGEPGERAVGPETKSGEFSLVWGKFKATSEVDFGDETKSKYSLNLEGHLEVPAKLDVVAVWEQFKILSMTDEAGKPVELKPKRTLSREASGRAQEARGPFLSPGRWVCWPWVV